MSKKNGFRIIQTEIECYKCFQLFFIVFDIVEEILDGLPEFPFRPVEAGIDNLLSEEIPKSLI